MKKNIKVVAAAIIKDGKLLAVQRSDSMTLPGMWEFPGGKIEAEETHQDALKREIKEELELDIEVLGYINTASYEYEFGIVEMSTYRAKMLSDNFSLNEHSQFKWLATDQVMDVEWAPVDIPAATMLLNNL
ncbi:(deoxy)nucleoside triphosphate pyrophosphohydrolase [Tuanshanicoccus lijuaniae]|uniref:(deoxy)nucleoside triphosphate pyrophosphohydrolase n=1 Tax=Aerococcaceae bacterium zg-1292 TaxID=2774330 RepID=UPI0019C529B8|nr:(deoxy)nucleoside triphosphate pyrophosphohydrolase [Aerococcaceae bacterium zg-1292]MBF6625465.1 (deoxy)nucleoside triphosphate pyrophosphohydrolase [Aerococcaceae bacterium zg-BR9]